VYPVYWLRLLRCLLFCAPLTLSVARSPDPRAADTWRLQCDRHRVCLAAGHFYLTDPA
jgi:hypothetical protein